ncbi:MAG: sigma-54 interaction domain-containing protein [Thermodesulfobacteriota bacterium]
MPLSLEEANISRYLKGEYRSHDETPNAKFQDIRGRIICNSQIMLSVLEKLPRIAESESTILIHGDSGTGKELIAQTIHLLSPRSEKPFIAINCALLSENFLATELFGHTKGAFTGAIAQKRGLLEEANGGTFFMDEVGCLSPAIQAKLLRVLEERAIRRFGETKSSPIDIRLIAATNIDLEQAVERSEFRKDLFYRLKVISLRIAPLRQRREDIPLLADHFLKKFNTKLQRTIRGFSSEVISILKRYDFPGNVRELENLVEHAVVMTKNSQIRVEDIPHSILEFNPRNQSGDSRPTLAQMEQERIIEEIRLFPRNLDTVARNLGINRSTLWRKMKKYGITKERIIMGDG